MLIKHRDEGAVEPASAGPAMTTAPWLQVEPWPRSPVEKGSWPSLS